MKDLDYWRKEIDRVDKEMAKLFEERMKIVEGVAIYKQKHNLNILDSKREREVISKNLERIEDKKLRLYYEEFLVEIMKISKSYQKDILIKKN